MTGTRDSFDLADALRAVGREVTQRPPLEASFFHRTLARWLGLAEGTIDGVVDPVSWSYHWWRADLVRQDSDVDAIDGRVVYCAHLATSEHDAVETVRWWVKKDARGRIVEAAWLSTPPRLHDDDEDGAPSIGVADEAALRRLFLDDD